MQADSEMESSIKVDETQMSRLVPSNSNPNRAIEQQNEITANNSQMEESSKARMELVDSMQYNSMQEAQEEARQQNLPEILAPMFSQREIEHILKEDYEQYDISIVLNSNIIESDLKKEIGQRKVVSKIIYVYG